MKHPLHGTNETEDHFIKRMDDLASGVGDAIVDAEDLQTLIAIARHWRRLETEAARHVETVICLRSHHFTGDPPYVGWEGLGRALKEDYDELGRLRGTSLAPL